jgi:branched-subunit amino acid transport protein
MDKNILAIIFVAVGTYLTRYLPIYLHNKLKLINSKNIKLINEILSYSSTSIISALFVTSFIKFPVVVENVLISIISLIFVIIAYKKWSNIGISILIGVLAYYITQYLLIMGI